MADCLDDPEFRLPSQFLSDEDFLADNRNSFFTTRRTAPVDFDSLEAESDGEDFLAELSRKMAHSTLHEGSKVRLLSGSPQSTLCPGWDLLCEAAGEVARLRLSEQLYAAPDGRRSPVPVPAKAHRISNGGLSHSHQQNSLSHAHQQLVANQIQQLKQQQALIKQQQQHVQQVQRRRHGAAWGMNAKANVGPYHAVQACGRKPDAPGVGGVRRSPAAPAWPSLQQQQNGPGMKAVFLGNPPSNKRERATGTGVFLPRGAGSNPEPRKRTACSTVLLPDKVVRALNLNLESIGSHPQQIHQYRLNGCVPSDIDSVWNRRGNGARPQQNQSSRPQAARPNHHEIRLPQEWTY